MKKKILSLFLALTLCLSLLPTAAFAADGAQDPAEPGEEILAPEQLRDPEKDPDPEQEQEGGPAGVSAPQTGAANSEIAVPYSFGEHPYDKSHCICNTYQCSKHTSIQTWWSIKSEADLKSAEDGKAYSLANDIELTDTWKPQGTIYLCMNGHSITMSSASAEQSLIEVGGGSACYLSITNCKANVGGGRIRHSDDAAVGPGITVLDGGTVELFDGDITQNSDGVVVENGGTLNVRGDISENTGAGVRVEAGGTLSLMSSGRILSNAGCGVDVAAGSNFIVSGGAEVRNNTKGSETCNVYLQEGATMKLSELSGAKIGVTVANLPTDGEFVKVTSDGEASRSDQNCITSDNASYRVFYSTSKSNGNLVLDARPTPLHEDHDSETFVNSLSSSEGTLLINGEEAVKYNYNGTTYYNLPDGNYYLEGDLTLSCGLLAYSTNVVLCLNGHNITVTGTSYVIYTAKKTSSGSYTFALTDCANEPGTLTHSYNQYANGGVCVRDGTFIMRGGKISGNNSGVYVYQGNEFKIYGGEISGNKGYGVSLTPDSKSYIYMTVGGTAKIRDNWADGAYNAATGLYEQGTTGTAKNVLFTDKPFKYITVDSSLKDGAEIGVTIWKTLTGERDYVAVATCGTSSSADASPYVKYFKSDSDAYKVWSVKNHVVIGVRNSEDQIHPVCGAVCNHKDASGDPVHEDIVWTPVSSESGLNNNGDNIYLTQDIELSRTWEISAGGTVNLCLNGHTIKANGDFDAITLTSNTNTLNICDCSESGSGKITHGTKGDGTTYSGAGVYMTAVDGRKATVNMYGGTIIGNTGHTVTVKNVDSTRGGGVYVDSNAQFSMRGGSITGNTADVGGGVYYTASNSLFVSGNVDITGNKDTSGAASNVNVPTSSAATPKTTPFYIGDAGLDTAATIGVRLASEVIATGEHSPVAQFGTYANAASAYHDGNFLADNGGVYGFKMEAREHDTLTSTHVVNLYNGLPHVHYLCNGKDETGADVCTKGGGHKESKTVEFKPWTEATSLPEEAGSYYLTKDVELEKTWDVPKVESGGCVNLCLNGHSITLSKSSSDKNTIRVGEIGTYTGLAISDCNGSGQGNGKITGASEAGVYVSSTATTTWFYLYGGTITGNGTGVHNLRDSIMYGGTITGNNVGVDYGTSRIATFRVSGDVQITGNQSADGTANNVHLNNRQTVIVSGALGKDAKIGVTTASAVADGGYATVAKGDDHDVRYTLTTDDLNHFESDAGYTPMLNGNTVIFANGKLHQHAACGKTGCTDGHSDVIWTPLTYDAENKLCYGGKTAKQEGSENLITYVLPAGNYYLSDNIEIDGFIQINGGVNLCLNGKTLSTTKENWSAQYFTFIVVSKGGTLTLCDCESGGTISANNLDGGVQTNVGDTTTSGGKFIMYGGTIAGVNYGVRAAGEFVMYGGAIKTVQGGAYTTSSGNFRMYGGEISGNRSYGVRFNGTTVTVGGSAKITGNGYTENVTLGNGTITIDPSLTQEARIGVHLLDSDLPAEGGKKLFATGATGALDYAAIFSCDNGSDYVLTKDTSGNLYFGKHQHVWSYTAEGATITATCTANGCNLPNQSGGSVTIVAPDKNTLTYDGNTKEATLEGALTTGVTLPDIKYYYKIGEQEYQLETGAKPTNAKSYRAEITVGGVNASVSYEIKKATPQASDFLFSGPNDPTYDGNPKTATVTSAKIDADHIKVKYYQGETVVERPTEAGTYTVKIDVEESGNYNAASDLTNGWTFEIAKNTNTPVVTLSEDYSLTYNKSQLTPPVTVTVDGKTLTKGTDYEVTYAENLNAGTNTGVVYIEAKGNYGFEKVNKNFNIAKKSITVTADNKSSRVGQTLKTLTYTHTEGLPYAGDTFSGALATDANENAAGTYTITRGELTLGDNYDITFVNGTYTVQDKMSQDKFKFAGVENGKVTKTYGDPDFKFEATDQVNGSDVTGYDSSDKTVATVTNDGTVHILKVGTTTITATASATDDYAQGVATYELTVEPKTLTADDLVATGSTTKTYDGNEAATGITVSVADGVLVNNDTLPITGSAEYNSKDVATANTITFTPKAITEGNYRLAATEKVIITNGVKINKRTISIKSVSVQSKQYDGDDHAASCIIDVTFDGLVEGETLAKSGIQNGTYVAGDYGIPKANFNSANVNEANKITGEVGFIKNDLNYTFKNADGTETNNASFEVACTITPANSWSLTPVNDLTIRYNNRDSQTYTPDWLKLLPDGQKWTYNLDDTKLTGNAKLADHSIRADSGVLSYQLSAGDVNDTVTWTITASCSNYKTFTLTVTLTLIARNEQTGFKFENNNAPVNKTYGDEDFTIAATGAATGSKVTYTSSDETIATVDNTGKVTIVGAGNVTIKAKASETADFEEKEISYALTVKKLPIPVPTPGKNELEYNGKEQTYMPVIEEAYKAYCEITGQPQKDVSTSGDPYYVYVSLKNLNVEWADEGAITRTYPFRITPKPITVKALDKKITTGQPAPELSKAAEGTDYTIDGLFDGDSFSNIELYYADPADTSDPKKEVTPDTSKAGTYAIVARLGGATGNPNYAPTFHTGTLTIANRPSSGGGAVTYPVSIPDKVENGSVSSDVKNASKGSTVTITIKPEDGFKLANLTVIDKDGNKLEIADKGDGKYTFIMPAGKVEVKASFTKEVETSPFADVATDAYYYNAVKWAADKGITSGIGNGLFSPDSPCTRAQIVTFLWRAAGSPEPKTMSGFSDVPENSYYAKAVAWAVENGITVGTSSTTFSPEATCTRAQSVTFLFRAAKASADGTPAFSDVTANAYYAEAVKWATDNGITNGIGDGLFGPDNDCTRAQIVTFLWRLYAGK